MNYSITDSRLKQIIDTFITDQVGTLTKHSNVGNHNDEYYWWTDKHGMGVFDVSWDYKDSLGVYDKLWLSVKELFNLSDDETNESFLRWAYHHMGMEFEDVIVW